MNTSDVLQAETAKRWNRLRNGFQPLTRETQYQGPGRDVGWGQEFRRSGGQRPKPDCRRSTTLLGRLMKRHAADAKQPILRRASVMEFRQFAVKPTSARPLGARGSSCRASASGAAEDAAFGRAASNEGHREAGAALTALAASALRILIHNHS